MVDPLVFHRVSSAPAGFAADHYLNATALVITFTVNNYHDPQDPRLSKALAWEAVYLDFVRAYVRDRAPRFGLTIAYSAEVSSLPAASADQ